MSSTTLHRRSPGRSALLVASLLASVLLAACGGSSSSSSPAASTTSATAASARAASGAPASPSTASVTSASAGAPSVAGVSLNQLNAKLKHLTPQQIAQIKARLPLYIKTQEACIKQVGQEATNVLACLHQHGF